VIKIKENKYTKELYISLFLIVFGLVTLYIIFFQIEKVTLTGKLNTRTFPLSVTFLLLTFSIIYLIDQIKRIKNNKKMDDKEIGNVNNFNKVKIYKKLFMFLLLVLTFFISLEFIGYLYSAVIFSAIISLFLGATKWYLLFACLAFPLIIYYVFHILLLVPLP